MIPERNTISSCAGQSQCWLEPEPWTEPPNGGQPSRSDCTPWPFLFISLKDLKSPMPLWTHTKVWIAIAIAVAVAASKEYHSSTTKITVDMDGLLLLLARLWHCHTLVPRCCLVWGFERCKSTVCSWDSVRCKQKRSFGTHFKCQCSNAQCKHHCSKARGWELMRDRLVSRNKDCWLLMAAQFNKDWFCLCPNNWADKIMA